MPPRNVGGNLDTRHLTRGSTLYLPIEVPGALFSIGDGHLAQGDGEVCVTGIEGPLGIACRFDIIKGLSLPSPEFETPPGSLTAQVDHKGFFAATGVDEDLYKAAKKATKHLVDRLTDMYQIEPRDAYILASVAADLKVSEVVDPNLVVTAYMPKAVFLTEPRTRPRVNGGL
jgi:acetamidase/formamidase